MHSPHNYIGLGGGGELLSPNADKGVRSQSLHASSSLGSAAVEGLKRAGPAAPSCVHWRPELPGELGRASCAELSNSPQSARKGLCL